MRTITLKQLESKNACHQQLELFQIMFGDEVTV